MQSFKHIPVLLKEVINFLKPAPHKVFIDATIGGGGHAEALLKTHSKVIGIDCDEEAISASEARLSKFKKSIKLVRGNFVDIIKIVEAEGLDIVDGILFDLGVSSYQIDTPERGFSLRYDGPLDMRMDQRQDIKAADLIDNLSIDDLEEIFSKYGEEHHSRRIAKFIVEERRKKTISTTYELAHIIEKAIKGKAFNSKTRVFQALRIAVNNELDNLKRALRDSIDLLKGGGRLVVISYHSLEDRIVKGIFKEEAIDCICPKNVPVCVCGHKRKIKILTEKPIVPESKEIRENPRARSAKMRAVERL